ncbi:DUF3048 domain-containing protein [Actinomycetes bacterium NPDC127524]
MRKTFSILLSSFLLVAGCSHKQDDKPKQEPRSTNSTKTKDTDIKQGSYKYPLTGIGTKDRADSRAVAIMINNHPKARPQTGLSKADVVYEMLAEAGITRFLAVYQSEMPEQAGPVRSARDYFVKLAKGFNSIYIAHGYSPDAKKLLRSGYIDNLNGIQYDGTLFKRSSDRKAPHNSYITFSSIEKGAKIKSFDLTGAPRAFSFLSAKQLKELQGDQAGTVSVSYGSASFDDTYTYDSAQGRYKRYTNNQQTVEYKTGSSILLDNILVIEAHHKIIDSYGRRDINFTSGGKGYLFQKGKVNKVEWKNVHGEIVPFRNGKEAGLVPGKTWVNIIPDHPGLAGSLSYK